VEDRHVGLDVLWRAVNAFWSGAVIGPVGKVPVISRPERVIVVFARGPADRNGRAPGSTARPAARLHSRLLERALRTAAAVVDAAVHLVTTGPLPLAEEMARRSVPARRLVVRAQQGDSPQARLQDAVHGAFLAGAHRAVVIGVDSPELRPAHLRLALDALDGDGARAVLGPARDGGYYLLGLSRFSATPFADMRFGAADVLVRTTASLAGDGFMLTSLEPLHDLDDRQALVSLALRLRWRSHTASDLLPLVLALLSTPVAPLTVAPMPSVACAIRGVSARGPPSRSLPVSSCVTL
jgi:glycosyltransferase A (GT-A) superfamily protein (DUF2064 family)